MSKRKANFRVWQRLDMGGEKLGEVRR